MKQIIIHSKLLGQQIVLVDDADFDWLNQFTWNVFKNKKRRTPYVTTTIKGKTTYMHRLILGLTNPKVMSDHIDRNGLNNQRNNLRSATFRQNNCNRGAETNGSSKFKGVSWDSITKKWRARVAINRKTYRLGRFLTQEDAALAYNKKAAEVHGQFAFLNNGI